MSILKETNYTIPSCPISIGLLADLHNQPFDETIASLQKHHPQAILIAGDLLYGSHPHHDSLLVKDQIYILPFLEQCAKIAPTYLSLGNHEMMLSDEDMNCIKQTDVALLDNNWKTYNNIVFGGLTSGYVTSYQKFKKVVPSKKRYPFLEHTDPYYADFKDLWNDHTPNLDWLYDYISIPGYHILLSHHPEYYDWINKNIRNHIDLIVSGHAHGGQWNYYSFFKHRWCGIYAPDQGFFPKYTSGIYHKKMIVSRGLSNTTWIPRINNPIEIVYIN